MERPRFLKTTKPGGRPPTWVIEWTADGADYHGLGTSAEPDFTQSWPVLQTLLERADKPLTRRDIFRAWPDSAAAPSKITLWRWLSDCIKDGRILHNGGGNRKDPFTYELPGMVDKWHADFLAEIVRGAEMMREKTGASSPG
ncbi:MAG: hypothetical protein ACJ8FY_17215 [Gemmataceae bacterium]